MFSDETLDPVTVRTRWRRSQQEPLQTRSSQTEAVHRGHAGVQTRSTTSSWTQTEPQEPSPDLLHQNPAEPDPPGLLDFLQRTEDLVLRELQKTSRSHAFHGFQADWDQHRQRVLCVHRLQRPAAQDQVLHVSSVSWTCTGSVLVCAYGRTDDGDWTNHKSCVCLWNLDRRNLNPKQPDLVLDVPTAVTSVCCHPKSPALIAGGLYSGEVLVWDTSRTQDLVLGQTGMSAEGHREPVYQVSWVPLQRKGDFGVLSSSSGGRVLLWTLDLDQTRLVLDSAYAFVPQQVPHSSRTSTRVRGSSTVGVTALALSPWDPDTFLVGSEGGLLLRCSFSSQTPAAVPPEDRTVVLRAPAVFSFRPSSGPVHSIHCSPFHRNLFASAGTEGLVQVHSLLQTDPVLSIRASDSYLFQVQWSPSRPLVLAAATGHGPVHIFDLARRSLRPAATVEEGGANVASTCLAFNHQNPRLLAVGRSDGSVGVWQLSSELVDPGPTESGELEQIANQVSE
ncbi:cytoplasmic dynein 2 intermediate chain 2 [Austrofundulus limnaeus]|uniref:WD repeat-containing protein 34 n=1 Tax=Austrofundulus limnaeus TaxID=52670 RepID=A0A2I4CSR2_AUSLI|nr:PREDICTED: WD repeat-containing protein 34 [Austrofundulus limnaeus]XP_013883030.1 PREDICTED: WD repeat-containing protein 34 [Austrofundulus limnaeus]